MAEENDKDENIDRNSTNTNEEQQQHDRNSASQVETEKLKLTTTPSGPPDGGPQAWGQVAGSFMLYFNTWGIMNAFGVYQTYYESGALFNASSSQISWIGALAAFLLLTTGMFAGPIFDRGYLRTLLLTGSFLVVFGNMMLSLCHAYWQVILAQGVTIGLGTGLIFVPCVAILSQYFQKRLGTAIGIAAVGSSLGGIIYPIVLYRLIYTIGFRWATRVVGFIALGTLSVPIFVLRLRVKPAKIRSIVDWSAFTDFPYLIFGLLCLVMLQGLYVVLFYLSYYSDDQHFTSAQLAFYLVAIFNAGSCFGRSIPNILSDRIGPLNVLTPAVIFSGVLMLCMLAVKNAGGIVTIAVLSGFMSGSLIAIPPILFVGLSKDKSKIGTRIGMGMALQGLGTLSGGPGAGDILGNAPPLNWTGLWVYGGVSCCAAGFGFLALRIVRAGWKINVKA